MNFIEIIFILFAVFVAIFIGLHHYYALKELCAANDSLRRIIDILDQELSER